MKVPRSAGRGAVSVAIGGLLTGFVGIVGAGIATADPPMTLSYHCDFPSIGSQQVFVQYSTTTPNSVPPGQPAGGGTLDAILEFSPAVIGALEGTPPSGTPNTLGGQVDFTLNVKSGLSTVPVKVQATVPQTPISQGGGWPGTATGDIPAIQFSATPASVTIGEVDLNLAPPLPAGSGTAPAPIRCVEVPGQNNTLITSGRLPTPARPTADPGNQQVSLNWAPVPGATGYQVLENGQSVASVTKPTAMITGLTNGTSYGFTVEATDGTPADTSSPSPAVTVTPAATVLTAPANVQATPTSGAILVTWAAVTNATGYDVYENGQKAQSVSGQTVASFNGLTNGTSYSFYVEATDGVPADTSLPSATTAATPQDADSYSYGMTGSPAITTANGTIPIDGIAQIALGRTTGSFFGDFVAVPTTARLKVLGVLPITADVSYSYPTGTRFNFNGSLNGGVLKGDAKLNLTFSSFTLFGMFVGGSPTCTTASTVDIPVSSTTPFNPLTGGPVSGTFTMPGLTGCGNLTPLLSAIVAGKNDTFSANLSYQYIPTPTG